MENNMEKIEVAEVNPSNAEAVIDAVRKSNEKVNINPNCIYYECIENGFCDRCNRKCDGIIKAKGVRAQVMDESKMCLKVLGDPIVYYVSPEEGDRMVNGSKAAYVTFSIGREEMDKFLDDKEQKYKIKLFVGVRNDKDKKEG